MAADDLGCRIPASKWDEIKDRIAAAAATPVAAEPFTNVPPDGPIDVTEPSGESSEPVPVVPVIPDPLPAPIPDIKGV